MFLGTKTRYLRLHSSSLLLLPLIAVISGGLHTTHTKKNVCVCVSYCGFDNTLKMKVPVLHQEGVHSSLSRLPPAHWKSRVICLRQCVWSGILYAYMASRGLGSLLGIIYPRHVPWREWIQLPHINGVIFHAIVMYSHFPVALNAPNLARVRPP